MSSVYRLLCGPWGLWTNEANASPSHNTFKSMDFHRCLYMRPSEQHPHQPVPLVGRFRLRFFRSKVRLRASFAHQRASG